MKQGEDDSPVTGPPPRVRRAEVEQSLHMLRRKHRNNDGAYRRGVNVAHRASLQDGLSDAPVEESS